MYLGVWMDPRYYQILAELTGCPIAAMDSPKHDDMKLVGGLRDDRGPVGPLIRYSGDLHSNVNAYTNLSPRRVCTKSPSGFISVETSMAEAFCEQCRA